VRYLEGPLAVRSHRDLEAFFEPVGCGPVTYRVRYQDLRALAVGRPARAPVPGLTALPAELRERQDLRDLAADLARGAARDAATLALAIARGLQRRCGYSLEQPTGDSPHALDNFLFGSRTGSCMHFASALAILLRLEGVPCRIAVGLYGGEPDRGDPEPVRRFGSRDAHAWVEVPLEGLGWVPFDATPAAALPSPAARVPATAPDPTVRVAREVDRAPHEAPVSLASRLPVAAVWPWLALAALLWLRRLRPPRRAAGGQARPPDSPAELRAQRLLRKLVNALAARGRPRAPGQTLEAYAAALASGGGAGLDLGALHAAFTAYQEVRFGGRPLDGERERALRAALAGCR
jgi:hypothetical protein